ncbi:MAG: hypothetical protein M1820_000196 [Bogoriella megaspora]|nr:MAG: hypothetical protein M1820_000196 [Bogoriella megaspora]
MFFHLLLLPTFVSSVLSQSCWRDTACTGPMEAAFSGAWDSNIYAPASRTVSPVTILSLDTGETISDFLGTSVLSGNGSALVFDFGKEVGGIVTLEYSTTAAGAIGLAFTEGKNWIGEWSDSSNGGFKGPDGAIYSNFTGAGNVSYTMPDLRLRGGFRYLTLFLITDQNANATISSVDLEIAFQPTWSNLQAYQGYFHSSDDTLNKIWYSGAYTIQTNSVPVNTGRQVPFTVNGWANNGTLANGSTVIVDGAKRDRAVWPGDMGVAVPSTFVSVGDLDSVKNALQVMYDFQNADGSFPEAGPPLLQQGSDTYHMWTMIGTYNYVFYTNDTAFLAANWPRYTKAMEYVYGKVLAPSGLLNVTGIRDWARWQQGFNNTEANIILYHTLNTGAQLATWLGDTTNLSSTYTSRAAALQSAIQEYCYDSSTGSFKDNATATALRPQDANSLSLLFSLVDGNSTQGQSISSALTQNWTPIGAVAPELPNNISPFISSFEIQAHLIASQPQRALDLIRRSWGWYLNNPNGTQSTVIEGYLFNGSFGYRNSRGYSYDSSYVSHAHGWSSGPTSTLTEWILGLRITGVAGSTWTMAPQFGDLTYAEGGFTTVLGKFQGRCEVQSNETYTSYSANVTTPGGTTGEIVLPSLGETDEVVVDGEQVGETGNRKRGVLSGLVKEGKSWKVKVEGGVHSVDVFPTSRA